MARKRANKPRAVASIFKKLLPQDYARKRAEIDQLQQFFGAQASDAVFGMVTVVNVTEQYLHVTVPSATLAAYLRLHSQQIRQMLLQNFNLDVELKISTRPVAEDKSKQEKKAFYADISSASCQQMESTADYVEDDNLKAALKSLSKTLGQRRS